MNNQQTTPKEYQTQDQVAKLLATLCASQLVSELDEMTINNIVDDDIGFPYSGDHLDKFRSE